MKIATKMEDTFLDCWFRLCFGFFFLAGRAFGFLKQFFLSPCFGFSLGICGSLRIRVEKC